MSMTVDGTNKKSAGHYHAGASETNGGTNTADLVCQV
jgi:hypothetical protein